MIDRQDSKTPRSLREPNAAVDNLAHRVIGAAIEVHRHLGPGFSECVYEESLAIELGLRAIPFVRQIPLPVIYKGHRVGEGGRTFSSMVHWLSRSRRFNSSPVFTPLRSFRI